MKKYFTLVQKFNNDYARDLREYLENNKIEYKMSADPHLSLVEYGLPIENSDEFYLVYTVLIEDYELSAVLLSVDSIYQIRNKPSIERLNKIRQFFSWILKT